MKKLNLTQFKKLILECVPNFLEKYKSETTFFDLTKDEQKTIIAALEIAEKGSDEERTNPARSIFNENLI